MNMRALAMRLISAALEVLDGAWFCRQAGQA